MTRKKRLIVMALTLAAYLLLPLTGVLAQLDTELSDRLYQRGSVSSGKIVLVQIDEEALARFGSTPSAWDRAIYAQVLENLNASEEDRPAVIGLDVLFAYDTDTESDEALAEAAGQYGNVVTAEKLLYETVYTVDGDSAHMTAQATEEVAPYAALRQATVQGVVNPLTDDDGVIRRFRLRYTAPDGEQVPSFPLAVAQKYAENTGLTLSEPTDAAPLLRYTFPAGGYSEGISLADVYDGTVPSAFFRNKIVLIGAYASALQDEYRTPIDSRETMYGVELHANAVDMLLSGEKVRAVPEAVQLIALAALLTLCALANLRVPIGGAIGVSVGIGVLSVLGCVELYGLGWQLHPLYAPLGAAVLLIVGIVLRYVTGETQKRALRTQFSRYVDPQVLDSILAQGSVTLTGSKRSIAVLFVDVCGFTALSEKLPPEEVVQKLDRFLGMMTECVMAHHGTLDKFMGDCCMAFWNAPVEQDDPVMEAVRAGLDMVASAERLNRELGVGFAVGIHCGEAVVGNIGSEKRMDYTAIGDTVNTASRLESLKLPGKERAGSVYVSQAVMDALDGRVEAIDLGEHAIRGKQAPVRVYSVTGVKE